MLVVHRRFSLAPSGGMYVRTSGRADGSARPKGLDRDDYLHNVTYGPGDAPPPRHAPPGSVPPQAKPFELRHARLVFCIPENKELRGYWDRVEDRLNKIRNCMDIAGVRRQLELFAPEIDPRMLVRMKAAGLTLDDVMNVTSGNLPPYRFTYLIDKAKQHAALVQGFGAQLLSALEKRDGEELTRLRTVHEQNLLKLRSQMHASRDRRRRGHAGEPEQAAGRGRVPARLLRGPVQRRAERMGARPADQHPPCRGLPGSGEHHPAAVGRVEAAVPTLVPRPP